MALAFTLAACSGEKDASGSAENAIELTDADVVIAKTDITDKAQFIPVTVDGTKMEVIAVKAPDGTVRTAFNTCQVCYDSGQGYYIQDGDVLECQNCGNRFEMSLVEIESGGCNPVPIFDSYTTETEDEIVVPLEVLKEATPLFGNWKKA
jgi:uncharacterized membrane protein